ncbi:MAG: hypothetical protein ACPGUE_21620 [Marinomonas sp.]
MSGILLDDDHFTGIKEVFHKEGNKITIHKTADVSKELEQNRVDAIQSRSGWKGHMHKVASIPAITLEIWREELKAKGYPDVNPLSAKNRAFLIAKLNNGDYARLRTKEGKL